MTIKALRAAANLTQKAFSELLNIPKRTIENWESEVNKPPTYLVELIEYFLKNENYIKKVYTYTTEAGAMRKYNSLHHATIKRETTVVNQDVTMLTK